MSAARYKVLSATPEYHKKFAAECERSRLNYVNGLELAIDNWIEKQRENRRKEKEDGKAEK